jgi:hypothetical protein
MDKDVLVQYYCVVVYIASRTRNYQQHNKIDAMLVRGSLTIKKRLQLLNPGGLQPAEGLIALSDAQM